MVDLENTECRFGPKEQAKQATREHENKHEQQQKNWHDANQNKAPQGPFPTKEAADKAGRETRDQLRKDFRDTVIKNDRQPHQPDKEWKGILEREKR
jgi:hypothetical protein